MLEFASEPDPVFLAIVGDALDFTRDTLYPFTTLAHPTPEDLAELDEQYAALYPNAASTLTRPQALDIVERLRAGLGDSGLLGLNDYHWLVMHGALHVFCDLHNDAAIGRDGKVGLYVIDAIDFGSIEERYFFDLDFLLGRTLLQSEERKPDFFRYTKTAWKIAAGLRPTPEEIELERVEPSESTMEAAEPRGKPWPTSGYVGPYPLRVPSDRPD